MCVIIHCIDDNRPSIKMLKQCDLKNPHGIGLAWREEKKIRYFKTEDVIEAHKIAVAVSGELVIHFRLASAGGICEELRHPFPITRTATTRQSGLASKLLFQNGTARGWKQILKNIKWRSDLPIGPMSDTRLAAYVLSLPLAAGNFKKVLEKFSETSRWLVMGQKSTRFGEWTEHRGFFFSNMKWKPLPKRQRASVKWDEESEWSLASNHAYAARRYKSYWSNFEK